jgi:hypothetical protein
MPRMFGKQRRQQGERSCLRQAHMPPASLPGSLAATHADTRLRRVRSKSAVGSQQHWKQHQRRMKRRTADASRTSWPTWRQQWSGGTAQQQRPRGRVGRRGCPRASPPERCIAVAKMPAFSDTLRPCWLQTECCCRYGAVHVPAGAHLLHPQLRALQLPPLAVHLHQRAPGHVPGLLCHLRSASSMNGGRAPQTETSSY